MSIEDQAVSPSTPKAPSSGPSPIARRVPERRTPDSEGFSDRKLRVYEITLLFIGVIVTFSFGAYQVFSFQTSLQSSTAATIYSQQQEIDKIFVDMPHLQPFFWYDQPLPAPGSPPIGALESSLVRAQAAGVASRILDHFEHLTFQMEATFHTEAEEWEEYMRESFRRSPTLCLTLWEDRDEYGGTADDSMWARYGSGNCPAVQAS